MKDDDDRTLLEAWQAGDNRAGDKLVTRYYSILRCFFINKVPREHVGDLVQTTFVECLKSFKNFEGRSSVKTYVFTIANRTFLKHLRTKRRKQDPIDPMVDSVEALSTGVFTRIARKLEQELLLEALRKLSVEHQTVLELFYWQQLTSTEGAEVLGIPVATFKSRLARAKVKLREVLESGRGTAEQRRRSCDSLDKMATELRDKDGEEDDDNGGSTKN